MQIAASFFLCWQPVTYTVSLIKGPPQLNREETIYETTNCLMMRAGMMRRHGSLHGCDFHLLINVTEEEKGDPVWILFVARRREAGLASLCLTDLPCRISPAVFLCEPVSLFRSHLLRSVCALQLPTHYTTPCCAFQASTACLPACFPCSRKPCLKREFTQVGGRWICGWIAWSLLWLTFALCLEEMEVHETSLPRDMKVHVFHGFSLSGTIWHHPPIHAVLVLWLPPQAVCDKNP